MKPFARNLAVVTITILGVFALYTPASAASLSPNHPQIPHSCPGQAGTTVSDTQGCPGQGKGIQPLCSGGSCYDGQDPVQSGCDGNVSTLQQSNSFSSNGHTWVVQLRYSNTCHTVWTRLSETSGNGAALTNPVGNGTLFVAFCCNPTFHGVNFLSGVYDGAWTNMQYVGSCAWQTYGNRTAAEADNISGSTDTVLANSAFGETCQFDS
jgi:hypothetical protein